MCCRIPIAPNAKKLAEREGESLHAGIEKFDLESPVFHRSFLPDELIQAMFLHRTGAVHIGIAAVVVTGRRAIELHFEANGLVILCAENEMQIARMKAECDFAIRFFKD